MSGSKGWRKAVSESLNRAMNLQVEIEKHSGFCGGVIRAISRAEKFLEEFPGKTLYSLGDIVHNEAELRRLGEKGLVTIDKEGLMNIPGPSLKTLLIRAHGEPPQTYSLAQGLGLTVIDCTCPVVLKLQKSIREAYERVKPDGGQIIIFGKIGHAEVLGLLGQVDGDAVVIENMPMLLSALESGSIKTDRPLEIFSQTTKSPVEYSEICRVLSEALRHRGQLISQPAQRPVLQGGGRNKTSGQALQTSQNDGPSRRMLKQVQQSSVAENSVATARNAPSVPANLTVHQTICSQVATRHEELAEFALKHDVVIFVSGSSSSNGKVLFDLCKSRNPHTYHISEPSELKQEWFSDGDKVGICGATSTPGWLLEQVHESISNI